MTAFTVYDETTGEILRSGQAPDSMVSLQPGNGESVIRGASEDMTQYVDLSGEEPAVVDRAAINPSVLTSTGQIEITNLPDPCEILWNGQSAEATGGSATITFDEPGIYTLTLRAEPAYLERTLEVEIP